MPELNIAIALSSLRQPMKKALHTAAQLGASGVEIDARNILRPRELSDTGRRQLRKMMSDLNLTVASIRFPTRRGYDVAADLDQRIDATKEAMRFAYSLGTRVVVNAAGQVPDEATHPAYAQLQESLSDLARYGHHVGAMLACETGSEPVDQLVGLLDSLPEAAIGIAFNPGNLIINDFYDDNSARQAASRILHVTARDAVRDLSRGRGIEVPLGQGSAEFPEIIGQLEQQHYGGWYTIERTESAAVIDDLSNSVSFLRAM